MASAAQQQKFTKFSRLAERDRILVVLETLVSKGELLRSERGDRWGVTVCPDKLTLMRLNAGNRCHSDVVDIDGYWHLRVYVVAGLVGGRVDSHFKLTESTKCRPGFREVSNSMELRLPLSEANDSLLDDSRVASAFRAHLESGPRRALPNSAWHNPLLDPLLDG